MSSKTQSLRPPPSQLRGMCAYPVAMPDVPSRALSEFDAAQREALRRLWFVGDVHGQFEHIGQALRRVSETSGESPSWLVFLGDIHLVQNLTFREALEPLLVLCSGLQVASTHGTHDAVSHEIWMRLQESGDAVPLHGTVVEMCGVRVAGLGGNFQGKVWSPPSEPLQPTRQGATFRHPNMVARGQLHSPRLHAAIYKEEVELLARSRADILVTHEAFSCHRHGWEALDDLARRLGVVRAFHGHTHDDLSIEYRTHRERMKFDAVAVDFRCVKNGLGEGVLPLQPSGIPRAS